MIRSGADPTTVRLADETADAIDVIPAVRELLFSIVQHEAMPVLSTEAQWFYHAVKQESAAAIYHGFSILFPSLLDRLQVMNKLLDGSTLDYESASPAKKLLTPMLVPCFASAKMLFQLMSNSEMLFATNEVSATFTVISFQETLIDSLWRQSSEIIERGLEGQGTAISDSRDLESLEHSDEFKCLNVLLRATLFWCSCMTESGWEILESACTKLIQCLLALLEKYSTLPSQKGPVVLSLAQHSFPGKLLPFLLLSAFSLPSVRDSVLTLVEKFWPQLEALVARVHSTLTELDNRAVQSAQLPAPVGEPAACVDKSQSTFHVTVTSELREKLSLEDTGALLAATVYKNLWCLITESPDYKVWKVKDLPGGYEFRRVTIPAELGKLLGSDTLLVKYRRNSPENDELDTCMAIFEPCVSILSQHIFPVAKETRTDHFEEGSVSHRGSACVMGEPSSKSDTGLGESTLWLQDLQKIIVWVGSGYAAALVVADEHNDSTEIDQRWQTSLLFKGGLDEDESANSSEHTTDKNFVLLNQIVDNTGAGKRLVDKLRNALDAGNKPLNGNPQLRATRLKRQDSVEATLEKSGGFEAVDRAVRMTFAVLLKHSNVSYISDPINKDGSIADSVIDVWRSALTLRRWCVCIAPDFDVLVRKC